MQLNDLDALSVLQPWAWCIVHGYKPFENRSWPTKRRGTIAIHAGKKFDREGYEWIRETFPYIAIPKPEEYERGGIVGTVNIIGCVTESDSPWFCGPYGFQLRSGRPLPFQPCRGKRGFFRPSFDDNRHSHKGNTP